MIRNTKLLVIFIILILSSTGQIFSQAEGGDKMADEKYTIEECHKRFAVNLNNMVWGILEKEKRTEEEDEKMVNAGHASLFHWSVIGKPINLQRGHWLISHVYSVLKRPEPAIYHAKRCMELTERLQLKDFDLAYAYEGLARAYAAAGDEAAYKKYYKLAQDAGNKIEKKEDRDLFLSDFNNEPWYDMK